MRKLSDGSTIEYGYGVFADEADNVIADTILPVGGLAGATGTDTYIKGNGVLYERKSCCTRGTCFNPDLWSF